MLAVVKQKCSQTVACCGKTCCGSNSPSISGQSITRTDHVAYRTELNAEGCRAFLPFCRVTQELLRY